METNTKHILAFLPNIMKSQHGSSPVIGMDEYGLRCEHLLVRKGVHLQEVGHLLKLLVDWHGRRKDALHLRHNRCGHGHGRQWLERTQSARFGPN